jgi:hypothetical protein
MLRRVATDSYPRRCGPCRERAGSAIDALAEPDITDARHFCGIFFAISRHQHQAEIPARHRAAAKKSDAAASASGARRVAASLPQRCRKPRAQASMTVKPLSLLQASPASPLACRGFAVVSPRFGRKRAK